MSNRSQRTLDAPMGMTDKLRARLTKKRDTLIAAAQRDVAAYLLDRADQYETDSPCWIALSDAAHNIMLGAVDEAVSHGELEPGLYKRVDGWKRKTIRPVTPKLGVEP